MYCYFSLRFAFFLREAFCTSERFYSCSLINMNVTTMTKTTTHLNFPRLVKGIWLTCWGVFGNSWVCSWLVAKDRLSELTSREGDWFLDELCSMSGNVNQLLLLLKDYPMVSINDHIWSFKTQECMNHMGAHSCLPGFASNGSTLFME